MAGKRYVKLQLLALFICYIVLISIYKDGDRRDFDNFIKRASSLGYHVEEHYAQTADGFTISIHRINTFNSTIKNNINNNNSNVNNTLEFDDMNQTIFMENHMPNLTKRNPILMGHGLGGSSDVFIRNIESKSIAFFLANQGYDVFIMNSRGNIYSNQHNKYTRESSEYWDFSFSEMAKFDLLSVSNYILQNIYNADPVTSNDSNNNINNDSFNDTIENNNNNITNQEEVEEQVKRKINYIGHSQGCTIILAALSEQYVPSEYFEDIILLTPAAITKNTNSAVSKIIKKYDILETLRDLGMHEFLKMNSLNYYACRAIPYICKFTVTITTDTKDSPINYDLFYQLMYHYPAGTSTKAYIHFNQLMKVGKFQHFDYGMEKNLEKYNSTNPPLFNLSNIVNKIHIIAGSEDVATPLEDIYQLKNELVNSQNVTVAIYHEGHCSFILGKENEYLNYIPEIFS